MYIVGWNAVTEGQQPKGTENEAPQIPPPLSPHIPTETPRQWRAGVADYAAYSARERARNLQMKADSECK